MSPPSQNHSTYHLASASISVYLIRYIPKSNRCKLEDPNHSVSFESITMFTKVEEVKIMDYNAASVAQGRDRHRVLVIGLQMSMVFHSPSSRLMWPSFSIHLPSCHQAILSRDKWNLFAFPPSSSPVHLFFVPPCFSFFVPPSTLSTAVPFRLADKNTPYHPNLPTCVTPGR